MADEAPQLQLGQWITTRGGPPAVVSHIYDDRPHTVEVIYLDYRKRAINQDDHWVEGHWKLADTSGGYADRSDRLRAYVAILRERNPPPADF